MNYKTHCNQLIENIILQNKYALSIGLYTRDGLGENMLLIYEQFFNKHFKNHNRIEQEIVNYNNILSNSSVTATIGDGLAGLGLFFNFLNGEKLINTDTENILVEIDEFIFEDGLNLLDNNKHDFIHEGLGHILYIASRTNAVKDNKKLRLLIEALEKQKKSDSKGNIYWSELKEDKEIINLSLSHGLASKIAVLSKIMEMKIDIPEVNDLLEKSVNYMLSTKNTNNCGSIFPSSIINGKGNEKSRLAWCYGDLGIGIALWQAGEALKNETIKQEALNTFDATLKRIKFEDTNLQDAGICHGTVGVALLYNRIFKYTGKKEYHNAALFWCKQTITYLDEQKDFCNYKSLVQEEWYLDNSFLTGSSGIALALMSILSGNYYNWDRAFLLC